MPILKETCFHIKRLGFNTYDVYDTSRRSKKMEQEMLKLVVELTLIRQRT